MSNEQRLSFFLENYFSDVTEKKSSANHSLDIRKIVYRLKWIRIDLKVGKYSYANNVVNI